VRRRDLQRSLANLCIGQFLALGKIRHMLEFLLKALTSLVPEQLEVCRNRDRQFSAVGECAKGSGGYQVVLEVLELRKQYPRTAYEAKFSVPYTFASALLGGAELGLALVAEPSRGVLMERIAVAADTRYDTISRNMPPAAAFGHTKDGSS
jgi:hypothetical protein